MMATTIFRPTVVDDDGSGTTGTILDAAFFTDFLNKIDALFTGAFSIVGPLTVTGFGIHTFSAGAAGNNAIRLRNSTAGAANYAEIAVGNDSSAVRSYWEMFSTTYTPSGPARADGMLLENDGALPGPLGVRSSKVRARSSALRST